MDLPERTPDEIQKETGRLWKIPEQSGKTGHSHFGEYPDPRSFFIPKTDENRNRIVTDQDYQQVLKGEKNGASTGAGYG